MLAVRTFFCTVTVISKFASAMNERGGKLGVQNHERNDTNFQSFLEMKLGNACVEGNCM